MRESIGFLRTGFFDARMGRRLGGLRAHPTKTAFRDDKGKWRARPALPEAVVLSVRRVEILRCAQNDKGMEISASVNTIARPSEGRCHPGASKTNEEEGYLRGGAVRLDPCHLTSLFGRVLEGCSMGKRVASLRWTKFWQRQRKWRVGPALRTEITEFNARGARDGFPLSRE